MLKAHDDTPKPLWDVNVDLENINSVKLPRVPARIAMHNVPADSTACLLLVTRGTDPGSRLAAILGHQLYAYDVVLVNTRTLTVGAVAAYCARTWLAREAVSERRRLFRDTEPYKGVKLAFPRSIEDVNPQVAMATFDYVRVWSTCTPDGHPQDAELVRMYSVTPQTAGIKLMDVFMVLVKDAIWQQKKTELIDAACTDAWHFTGGCTAAPPPAFREQYYAETYGDVPMEKLTREHMSPEMRAALDPACDSVLRDYYKHFSVIIEVETSLDERTDAMMEHRIHRLMDTTYGIDIYRRPRGPLWVDGQWTICNLDVDWPAWLYKMCNITGYPPSVVSHVLSTRSPSSWDEFISSIAAECKRDISPVPGLEECQWPSAHLLIDYEQKLVDDDHRPLFRLIRARRINEGLYGNPVGSIWRIELMMSATQGFDTVLSPFLWHPSSHMINTYVVSRIIKYIQYTDSSDFDPGIIELMKAHAPAAGGHGEEEEEET